MKIEIDGRYVIESSTHDFVLYERKISKSGKTECQMVLSRLGFFNKIHQLVRALITHDLKRSDVETLQAMHEHVEKIAMECEKAFKEAAHV